MLIDILTLFPTIYPPPMFVIILFMLFIITQDNQYLWGYF